MPLPACVPLVALSLLPLLAAARPPGASPAVPSTSAPELRPRFVLLGVVVPEPPPAAAPEPPAPALEVDIRLVGMRVGTWAVGEEDPWEDDAVDYDVEAYGAEEAAPTAAEEAERAEAAAAQAAQQAAAQGVELALRPAPPQERWEALLARTAQATGKVVPGTDAREAAAQLGSAYAPALRCTEPRCFRDAADALEADLLTVAHLTPEPEGWALRLWTFDRDRRIVLSDVVRGAAPEDPALLQAGRELLNARVHALARRRALLRLRSNAPTGVVWLGERKLGVAAWMTVTVPPGRANLSVQAEGYRPYHLDLALAPGEARELVATLQRSSAPAAPGVSRAALRSTPSLFSRPALYTGAAGLLAAMVGLAVGQRASDIGSRAKDADGNGVLDVTMREVSAARSHARLANALLVAGGGLAGASALYLVLEPGVGRAGDPVAPGGVRLVTGGEF